MENLIHDLNLVNHKIDSVAMIFNNYVEYKKDDKKFVEHLKKLKEKRDVEQGTADKSSK